MAKITKYMGVYVLTHDAMPGMVKVGSGNIMQRITAHNASTVPFPFNCYYVHKLSNYKDVERKIHEAFKKFRVSGREFFSILYEDKNLLQIDFNKDAAEKSSDILAECVKAALSLFQGQDITEEINDALPEEVNEPLINLMKEVRDMDAAQRKEHVKKIIAFLDEHPKDANVKTRQGVTPLILAASWNLVEVIKRLLPHITDINAATRQGITALMKAGRHASAGVIELFLAQNGIDINALNKKGESALDYAQNKPKNAKLIRTAGGKTGEELAPPEPEDEE